MPVAITEQNLAPEEVLSWYESKERALSPEYLATIPWGEIKDYPIDPRFFPTLIYMRDVEKLTEFYYQELVRTPTGKDPVIRKFMDRWALEESLHGDLLNRFLEEAGMPTDDRWFEKVKESVPKSYHFQTTYVNPLVTGVFGHHFSAVHMTWGAVNEYSTLNGYHRLSTLANHPVLTHLLNGIMLEEARHALFYWKIAKFKLSNSHLEQQISRFFIDRFWGPVGLGTKTWSDATPVITTLFSGDEGMHYFESRVSDRIKKLPGFQDCDTFTKVIRQTVTTV